MCVTKYMLQQAYQGQALYIIQDLKVYEIVLIASHYHFA